MILESADNINDQIKIIEKYILSFSKIYNKIASTELLNFLFKDKNTQDLILSDIYNTHSELEQLLREIMEYGINAETLRDIKEYKDREEGADGDGSEEEDGYGAETEEHPKH